MQWSDVTRAPSNKMLRQFAGLSLVFFLGLAGWRVWSGSTGALTTALAVLGIVIGIPGLIWPPTVRYVYTAWMIAAFPIGWTVSRIALGIVFYALFTPIAWVFKARGRDSLHRRRQTATTYWSVKPGVSDVRDYFRQY